MICVFAGGVGLVPILLLLRAFAGADTALVTRGLRYSGAAVLLFAAIGLAAMDRVGLAMLAGSFAWGLFTGGRAWPDGWPFKSGPGGRSTSSEEAKTPAGSNKPGAAGVGSRG